MSWFNTLIQEAQNYYPFSKQLVDELVQDCERIAAENREDTQ